MPQYRLDIIGDKEAAEQVINMIAKNVKPSTRLPALIDIVDEVLRARLAIIKESINAIVYKHVNLPIIFNNPEKSYLMSLTSTGNKQWRWGSPPSTPPKISLFPFHSHKFY